MVGQIQVAQSGKVHIIRLLGDVRLNLCTAFDRYTREILGKADAQYQNILIDLSGAEGIDSTTLGQLAKISMVARERFNIIPTIFSPDSSITRLLDSMGFDQVFHILEEPCRNQADFQEWVDETIDEEQAREQVIAAHRVLMGLNENNQNTFRELVEALECSRNKPAL